MNVKNLKVFNECLDYLEARNIKRILHCVAFTQSFSNTSGIQGGIGGSAIRTHLVVVLYLSNKVLVFGNGKLAYSLDDKYDLSNFNYDLSNHNIATVNDYKGRYLKHD